MALKAVLESIDDLEEALKSEYKPQKIDGKDVFVLDVDNFAGHPGATGLKSAHDKTKKDLKEIKDKLTASEDRLKDLPEEFTRDEWDRPNQDAYYSHPAPAF